MEPVLPIIGLSLAVSLSAAVLAASVGLPLAAVLALCRFPGRGALVVAVNALLGLPPVVVGLVLYLLMSRGQPSAWLFTPWAMILAQTILAAPIVAALAHRALERRWAEHGRVMQASGAGRLAALPHLLLMARATIATAVLAGFGRAVSELGAAQLVGGSARIMTTAIAHEAGQGDAGAALGLALVLAGITVAASATVLALAGERRG